MISLKSNDPLPEIPPPSQPETKTASSENMGSVPAKKVNRLISEDNADAISLSVDDTLVSYSYSHSGAINRQSPIFIIFS